jgi:alpha-galactosidase
MSEANILSAAKGLQQSGLQALGYKYVNLDDCWAKGRYSNGTIYPDPTTFPNGMKQLGDTLHQMGFHYGIYTDRGLFTCQRRPGSFQHSKIDAETYVFFVKMFRKKKPNDA